MACWACSADLAARDAATALQDLSPLKSLGLHKRYFGNSAQFWMNLQTSYDLAVADRRVGARIKAEVAAA